MGVARHYEAAKVYGLTLAASKRLLLLLPMLAQNYSSLHGYTCEDIVPRGNNIVLFMLAECHDAEADHGISTMSKRKNLIGSLLLQIARLLDPDNRKPIRAVSYEIHPGNTKRLRSMGFQPVRKCTAYGDVPINVVVFDPTRRSWLVRNAMLILDDFVWRIRTAFDGMEQLESTMDGC